ncbi:MAG: glycyl-radical enzyme activating protein [Clostridiales bacterium]|nr:glycyl-radical enzyme activating protein [Clostridiales bacterium]
MKGNIVDIKKFTLHDGPGIRTTVFLKGCPLNCIWCQNPEGIDSKIHLWHFEKSCIGCHKCIAACDNSALSAGDSRNRIIIDRDKCTNLGNCVEVCPTRALSFDGRQVSAEEVVEILLEDRMFYTMSGGGITLSGGDPVFQPEFAIEILKACKKEGIHTAIETAMYSGQKTIERFFDHVDMFIVDLKIFDSKDHKKYTGVDNGLIKSNFEFIAAQKEDVLVRIPLIPGITTKEGNIRGIAKLVRKTGRKIPVELINFNPLAENKYRRMDKDYDLIRGMQPLSESELDFLYQILIEEDVEILRDTKI